MLCTDEPQNATVFKVCSRGTVKIGKMYSSLACGFVNTVYKRARGWLILAFTAAEFAGLYEKGRIEKPPNEMSAHISFTTYILFR